MYLSCYMANSLSWRVCFKSMLGCVEGSWRHFATVSARLNLLANNSKETCVSSIA